MLGDYNSAFHYLQPVHKKLPLLGGSIPQRLPMQETYVRCCLYHGKFAECIDAFTPNVIAQANGCVNQYPHCVTMLENWLQRNTQDGQVKKKFSDPNFKTSVEHENFQGPPVLDCIGTHSPILENSKSSISLQTDQGLQEECCSTPT